MSEVEILRSIVKRATSPMWWARMSYPDNPNYWSEEESAVLKTALFNKSAVWTPPSH